MAKIEATTTIDVETACAECDGRLDHTLTTDRIGSNILKVEFCQKCRDKEHEEAYDEGYKDGAEATT